METINSHIPCLMKKAIEREEYWETYEDHRTQLSEKLWDVYSKTFSHAQNFFISQMMSEGFTKEEAIEEWNNTVDAELKL